MYSRSQFIVGLYWWNNPFVQFVLVLPLRDRSRPSSMLACVGCINRSGLTHSVCDLTFVSGLWCSPRCSFIQYTFPFFSLVARGVVSS